MEIEDMYPDDIFQSDESLRIRNYWVSQEVQHSLSFSCCL